MADQVLNRFTSLPPEEVMVRAVQVFTNENWRAQSQTNRIATFVGRPKIPYVNIAIAVALMACFVIPGVIYYLFVIRKMFRLQNIVVTTTPKDQGSEVVVTFPPHAAKLANQFLGALSA